MTSHFPLMGPEGPADAPWGAAVVIWDAHRRALLQLRDARPGVVHGGRWALFGGGVEAGEDPHHAAQREVEEELGITLPLPALKPVVQTISRPGGARLHIFECQIQLTPLQIRLSEGAGFGFFTHAQLTALPQAPYLKSLFDDYLSWDA